MNAPPKRAVQFRLELQADTPAAAASALYNLSLRVDRGQVSAHAVSGGHNSGYECWMTIADHPTHEEFALELKQWLDRKAEAQGGKA